MTQDRLKKPFKNANTSKAANEKPEIALFHISEILTLQTGRTVVSKTRSRPDGQTEHFENNVFPLAKLMEFLTGVNMTDPEKEVGEILIENPDDRQSPFSVVDSQRLPPERRHFYNGQRMVEHARLAENNLRDQPNMEWLSSVVFPEKEFDTIPPNKESRNAFCQKWVEDMAQQHGEWHMLVSHRLSHKPAVDPLPTPNLH